MYFIKFFEPCLPIYLILSMALILSLYLSGFVSLSPSVSVCPSLSLSLSVISLVCFCLYVTLSPSLSVIFFFTILSPSRSLSLSHTHTLSVYPYLPSPVHQVRPWLPAGTTASLTQQSAALPVLDLCPLLGRHRGGGFLLHRSRPRLRRHVCPYGEGKYLGCMRRTWLPGNTSCTGEICRAYRCQNQGELSQQSSCWVP